jgi:mono/diheme cytochrome c family protein
MGCTNAVDTRGTALGAAALAISVAVMLACGSIKLALAQTGPNVERGKAVFSYWCAPCHAPGPGHPGTQSLQIKYGESLPAVLEQREDLTPEVVKTFVRQGVMSMAPFRKTEINDQELDALAAYLARAHEE